MIAWLADIARALHLQEYIATIQSSCSCWAHTLDKKEALFRQSSYYHYSNCPVRLALGLKLKS